MPDPLLPRLVALDLMAAVLAERRPLDEALEAHAGFAGLARRDRAFVRALVATLLRRLGEIDAALSRLLDRPLPKKARRARDLLRLGAAQLLFLGTPPHAAVDTSVALAAATGQGPYKRLVNAVLRRLARDGPGIIAELDAPRVDTPDWLWRSWSRAYGERTARRIAEAHLKEPPLDLTAKGDAGAWAERLAATVLPTGTLRRAQGGRIEELPGYAEGAWWVQDAAAALPARLLGRVKGARVLDLCAAPGGKTAQLAAAGGAVTTLDRSADRMERLEENLRRLRLHAAPVVADGTEWRAAEPFPFVLLDAPCTATGALRRHPDAARIKRPRDVPALAAVQSRLLEGAARNLAAGGVLVYCACSLEPEEGPERIAELLARERSLRRVPVRAGEIGGLAECLTEEGDLRTLPCHLAAEGGMDGFYAARLTKVRPG